MKKVRKLDWKHYLSTTQRGKRGWRISEITVLKISFLTDQAINHWSVIFILGP